MICFQADVRYDEITVVNFEGRGDYISPSSVISENSSATLLNVKQKRGLPRQLETRWFSVICYGVNESMLQGFFTNTQFPEIIC